MSTALLFFDKSDGTSYRYTTKIDGNIKEIHYFGDKITKITQRDFHPECYIMGYVRMFCSIFINDINTIIQNYYHKLYGNNMMKASLCQQDHICAIIVYERSWTLNTKYHLMCFYYDERSNNVYQLHIEENKNIYCIDDYLSLHGYDSQIHETINQIKYALRCPLPKLALYQLTGQYLECITIENAKICDAQRGDYLVYNNKKQAIYIGNNEVIDIDDGQQYLWWMWAININDGCLTIKYDVIPKYSIDFMIERARKCLSYDMEINEGEYLKEEVYINGSYGFNQYSQNVVRKFGKYYYDDKIQQFIPKPIDNQRFINKFYRYLINADQMNDIRAAIKQSTSKY